MIDLMRWYFGEPSSIFASLKYTSDINMEDQATIILDFNGTNAIIQTGWFTFGGFFQRVELHGTERIASSIDFVDKELQTTRKLLKATLGKVIEKFGNLKYYSGDPRIYRELEHFTKCLRENRGLFISGEDAIASLKIIEAAYESDQKGRFIQI
jgi:predicted dehydrogenase